MVRRAYRSPLTLFAAALLLGVHATAQCTSQWVAGDPRPTPTGSGLALTTWDSDGPGGQPPKLVAGGTLVLGGGASPGVFVHDGAIWSPLGNPGGAGKAFTLWNGQLIGAFEIPGSPTVTTVRAWNGSTWQLVGTVDGFVRALAVHQNQLYVGGEFTSVSGVPANDVACWTGSNWAALGTGITGSVHALASFDGLLRVGGAFTNAGGLFVQNLAYWNGVTWFGGPNFNNAVLAFAVRTDPIIANNYLLVGGQFTSYTTTQTVSARIARLQAGVNTWSPHGSGASMSMVLGLATLDSGFTFEVIAAGWDSASTQRVWRSYANGPWTPLGADVGDPQNPPAAALCLYVGKWTIGVSSSVAAIKAWNGTGWDGVVGQGIGGAVRAIESRGAEVVIGGSFAKAGGVVVNGIAQGSANAWTPLGTGVAGGTGVNALATLPNGHLIAAGDFITAGGVTCNHIARWDGGAWSALGAGFSGPVRALMVGPYGELIAAGDFLSSGAVPCNRIAFWYGGSWQPVPDGFNATVRALALLPNGDFVAAGDFTMAGAQPVDRIARWDVAAQSWQPMGSGCNDTVFALAVAPNGDLHAGGRFTVAGGHTTRLARWNNGAWSPTLSLGIISDVLALGVHPAGDLFVGGGLFYLSLGPFGSWGSHLVRIQAGGTVSPMGVTGIWVRDIAIHEGDLMIGGEFLNAGGQISVNLARFDVGCPATTNDLGFGCNGLFAPLTLQALEGPWLGAAWRMRANTFGPSGIGVQVLGLGQWVQPLQPLLPDALPGCMGWITPDDLQVGTPTAGVLTFGGPVPYSLSLVGAQLYVQVVQVETHAGGMAISSSNAVDMTVGVF